MYIGVTGNNSREQLYKTECTTSLRLFCTKFSMHRGFKRKGRGTVSVLFFNSVKAERFSSVIDGGKIS